jgi:hypothetical protein
MDASAVCRPPGVGCATDADCCTGKCNGVCTQPGAADSGSQSCQPLGFPCATQVDCCGGMICGAGGVCVTPGGGGPDAGSSGVNDQCIIGTWVFQPDATGPNGPAGVIIMGANPNYSVTFAWPSDSGMPTNPMYTNIPTNFMPAGGGGSITGGQLTFAVPINQSSGPDGGTCMPLNIMQAMMMIPPNTTCSPMGQFTGNVSNCGTCGPPAGGNACQGCGAMSCPMGFSMMRGALP